MVLGFPVISGFIVGGAITLSFCFVFLCLKNRHRLGLNLVLTYYAATLPMMAYFVKADINIEYILFSMIMVPIVTIDRKNIASVLFFVAIQALSAFIFAFGELEKVGIYEMTLMQVNVIRSMHLIELISFTSFQIYFYTKDTNYLRDKMIEQQKTLIENSRLSDLGLMAAGVAYEINNPLAVIKGNAELLKKIQSSEKRDKVVQRITSSCEIIVAIVNGLKHVARDGSRDDFEPVQLEKVLNHVVSITKQKLTNKGIEFIINHKTSEPVFCREVQIGQILINLFANSIDAVEDLESRWIKVDIYEQGDHIIYSHMDSGHGLDEITRSKIFNAFFTTKPVGKRTGLGLSIAKTFMHEHEGDIIYDASSEQTCFKLIFPKLQANANVA